MTSTAILLGVVLAVAFFFFKAVRIGQKAERADLAREALAKEIVKNEALQNSNSQHLDDIKRQLRERNKT